MSLRHSNSLLRSFYSVWDFFLLAVIYTATVAAEPYVRAFDYPHPYLEKIAHFSLWALYGYSAGLVATGVWVIAHGTRLSIHH